MEGALAFLSDFMCEHGGEFTRWKNNNCLRELYFRGVRIAFEFNVYNSIVIHSIMWIIVKLLNSGIVTLLTSWISKFCNLRKSRRYKNR